MTSVTRAPGSLTVGPLRPVILDLAARAAGAAVLYALGAGTVASLLGFALTGDLFRLMTVPREVAALGSHYLDTWLLGGPLVFGFFAIEATFRAAGDTRTPFVLLAASVLLSIGLDPLLIAGVGPFPRLGVEGAAVASVMVRGGGFLIGVGIALKRGLIRLDAPDWRAVLARGRAPLRGVHVAHAVHRPLRHGGARGTRGGP